MIKIENALVSDDLKDTCFVCDLAACHGECCVAGDAGAPLEVEEISILEDYLDGIKPFMSEKGREVIGMLGVFDYDADASYVSPLVDNRECAFVYFKDGISFCAIEKAWLEGKTPFQKPISCHLYPVRLKKIGDYTAVNYEKWDICKPALIMGEKQGVPLYRFLKEPLIRKFGEAWYGKLEKEMGGECPRLKPPAR